MSNPDWYLDPPDEPEDKHCEECFEEMEWMPDFPGTYSEGYWRCNNDYCPTKFKDKSIEQEMAYELVDIKQKYDRLKKLEAYYKQVTQKHLEGLEFNASQVQEIDRDEPLDLEDSDWIGDMGDV